MGNLEDKVALVTGASGGIGASIARALAAEKAIVVLVARSISDLNKVATSIDEKGGRAITIQADVACESDVDRVFSVIVKKFSRLDLLINNAGIFDGAALPEFSLDIWNRVIAVNLCGPFLCTRAAMRIMRQQLSGRIINIGSLSAKRVRPNSAAYSASKHALVGLTQVTALEGRPYGISCGILHPGNVAVDKKSHVDEAAVSPESIGRFVVAMAGFPDDVNILESVLLPVGQSFIGRG